MKQRRDFFVESLENRQLFALPWTDAYKVVDLDDAVASYPSITGTGTTVAVIDTGIDYNHPQLGGGFGPGFKVKAGYDFVNNDNDPMDSFGHGTANAGLIAALPYDFNGNHYQGIAPGASLVALRVSAGNDVVSFATIERALKWVIDNHQAYGISIVNFSFGAGRYTDIQTDPTVSDDFKTLADLGIPVLCPSGNGGGTGVMYPGADPNVVAVGSVSATDQISSFTQRGPLMDFLATGENLTTLAIGGGYTTVSDGSYCGPLVAGAMALLKQADPKLKGKDLLSIVSASSVSKLDSGATYPRLDIDNAILVANQRKPDAASDVGVNGAANDLAYDEFGVLHFASYDQAAHTIKYAARSTSGKWSGTTIIDNSGHDVGATLSLGVDLLGRPAVAYYDATDGDLKYARFDGRTWKRSTLDSKNTVGQFPSLAFDSSNNAVVSYYRKTSGDLRVMKFDGGAWLRYEVDTTGDVGQFDSLAINGAGAIGVAYADTTGGGLKYAQFNGSSWSAATVDDLQGTAAFVSLAFDRTNVPAISYYDAYPADLKYASKSGGTWTTQAIVSKGAVGLFTNLWFDDAGEANIVYYSRKSNGLFRVHGPLNNLAADTLTLLGGSNAAAAATLDGSAATYSWWNSAKNKIYTGDIA